MVVAEVRARHVPVEVLRLQVEREHIGEQRVERAGDVARGVGAEVGRRRERRLAQFLGFLDFHRSNLLRANWIIAASSYTMATHLPIVICGRRCARDRGSHASKHAFNRGLRLQGRCTRRAHLPALAGASLRGAGLAAGEGASAVISAGRAHAGDRDRRRDHPCPRRRQWPRGSDAARLRRYRRHVGPAGCGAGDAITPSSCRICAAWGSRRIPKAGTTRRRRPATSRACSTA